MTLENTDVKNKIETELGINASKHIHIFTHTYDLNTLVPLVHNFFSPLERVRESCARGGGDSVTPRNLASCGSWEHDI